MTARLEDSRYTIEFGYPFMSKLIAVADRAGCTTGEAMKRALLLLDNVLRETEGGGTLFVRDRDETETEIEGFAGKET